MQLVWFLRTKTIIHLEFFSLVYIGCGLLIDALPSQRGFGTPPIQSLTLFRGHRNRARWLSKRWPPLLLLCAKSATSFEQSIISRFENFIVHWNCRAITR